DKLRENLPRLAKKLETGTYTRLVRLEWPSKTKQIELKDLGLKLTWDKVKLSATGGSAKRPVQLVQIKPDKDYTVEPTGVYLDTESALLVLELTHDPGANYGPKGLNLFGSYEIMKLPPELVKKP